MVPVVNELTHVFPEELPGIPPDWDIDPNSSPVIILMPGIAPIYKTPYRMATQQLAELKEHITELLEKGYIHPSSSPWGAPVISMAKKDDI
jgi:hypothetical protein